MDDIVSEPLEAPIRIASDEFASGKQALRHIDLIEFCYRHMDPDLIEQAGFSPGTFLELIGNLNRTAQSCFEPSRRS